MARFRKIDDDGQVLFWDISVAGGAVTTRSTHDGVWRSPQVMTFGTAARAREARDNSIAFRRSQGFRPFRKPQPAAPKIARTSDAAIEKAILADPEDDGGYLVYADWLQGQDDPRGELAVLQHRASGKGRAAAKAAARATALLDEHAEHFLGAFAAKRPPIFELAWKCGFIRAARIGWTQDPRATDDPEASLDWPTRCRAELAAFLALPSARFLQELTLGPIPARKPPADLTSLAAAVERAAPPCLRTFVMTDLADRAAWTTAVAAPALRGLRALVLRGGSFALPKLDLPELHTARFETGALRRPQLRKITSASWPKLERLDVWLGEPRAGADCTLRDLAPILAATGLRKLTHLGLRNCSFADELAAALAGSAVLAQLETLDLSMGNLSDRGVTAMLAARERFRHLRHLDLGDNALTDAGRELLRDTKLAQVVGFGHRQSPQRARRAPFVTVGDRAR